MASVAQKWFTRASRVQEPLKKCATSRNSWGESTEDLNAIPEADRIPLRWSESNLIRQSWEYVIARDLSHSPTGANTNQPHAMSRVFLISIFVSASNALSLWAQLPAAAIDLGKLKISEKQKSIDL